MSMKKKLSLLSLLSITTTTLLGGDLNGEPPKFKERYPSPPLEDRAVPTPGTTETESLEDAIAGLALAPDPKETIDTKRLPSPPTVERCVTYKYDKRGALIIPWEETIDKLTQDPDQDEIDVVLVKTAEKLATLRKNYKKIEGPGTHASRKRQRDEVERINTLTRLQEDLKNKTQDLRGTISLLRTLTS